MTLNTWGGRAGLQPLLDFLKKYQETDIFCLQEIWQTQDPASAGHMDSRVVSDLLEQIAKTLPEFQFFFRPQFRGIYGLAMFVRKEIFVVGEGELFVFKEQGYENPGSPGNHARNIQHLTLRTSKGPVTVVNFHGLWNGDGKTDTADRLSQSRNIAKFLKTLKNPFVLAGDFNLVPQSESFRILAENFAHDLVTEHAVTSTRSRFYTKSEKMADYILTSSGLSVSRFEVLPDEVSDHLALRVSISID